MIETVSKNDFIDRFRAYDRLDNFSYEGLGALYDWLEECHEGYELDVIGLCCEYSEDDIATVLEEYNLESLDDLGMETVIVWHDDELVLYQVY